MSCFRLAFCLTFWTALGSLVACGVACQPSGYRQHSTLKRKFIGQHELPGASVHSGQVGVEASVLTARQRAGITEEHISKEQFEWGAAAGRTTSHDPPNAPGAKPPNAPVNPEVSWHSFGHSSNGTPNSG